MLSFKRRKFVEEYLRCWNATEAAKRAGYSERSAYSQGHRLLKNDEIAALLRQRIEETAMSANEVQLRLGEQARAEWAAYLQGDGSIDLGALIADGKAHLVKGVRWDSQGNRVIEFHDAQAALVHIGKVLGMFVDRQEVTGKDGGPLVVVNWDNVTTPDSED